MEQNDPKSQNDELKALIFASIISADNDSLTENVKQEIMNRYTDTKNMAKGWSYKKTKDGWAYILSPIEDATMRDRYIEILSA